MKRLIQLIMISMMLVTAVVVPQAVYGIDEEDMRLLTPTEQAFMNELADQVRGLRTESYYLQVVGTRNYTNAQEIVEGLVYVRGLSPQSCGVQSSPPVFESIRTQFNELCSKLGPLRDRLLLSLTHAVDDPGMALADNQFRDRMRAIGHESELITESARDIYEMAENLAKDLIDTRKDWRAATEPVREDVKDIVKQDNKNQKDNDQNNSGNDSDDIFDTSCFIATAAYGSPDAAEIDILRQFRDEFLLHNYPGRVFVTVYYATSPPVADFISGHEVLRTVVRECFVAPVVTVVELAECWWAE